MKCPDCGIKLDASKTLVPGVEVNRCGTCKTFRIKGDDVALPGGPGVMDCLRFRASEVMAKRRHKEMIESDISDPRWEHRTQ